MLKLSAIGEYSLLLVRYLGENSGSHRLTDIATALSIPEPMLRKIANRLARAEVINSELGRFGGVSASWKILSIYDVLWAAGEDLSVTTCTGSGDCEHTGKCSIEPVLGRLQRGFEAMLRLQKI